MGDDRAAVIERHEGSEIATWALPLAERVSEENVERLFAGIVGAIRSSGLAEPSEDVRLILDPKGSRYFRFSAEGGVTVL